MAPMPMPRWPALDPLADAVNPALGLMLLAFVLAALRRRQWREGVGLPLTLVAMLAIAYGVAYFDRAFGIAALVGLDFSTHGAVHLAAWATLLTWQPRRWPWALGVSLAYHALMLAQGYHTALDLLATTAVMLLPLTLLGHALRPATRPSARSAPSRHNRRP